MVGINGKIIAEPNDSNTVHCPNASDGKIMSGLGEDWAQELFGITGKTIVAQGGSGIFKTGSTTGAIGAAVKPVANQYLCTDANGNLIFKEL